MELCSGTKPILGFYQSVKPLVDFGPSYHRIVYLAGNTEEVFAEITVPAQHAKYVSDFFDLHGLRILTYVQGIRLQPYGFGCCPPLCSSRGHCSES